MNESKIQNFLTQNVSNLNGVGTKTIKLLLTDLQLGSKEQPLKGV